MMDQGDIKEVDVAVKCESLRDAEARRLEQIVQTDG